MRRSTFGRRWLRPTLICLFAVLACIAIAAAAAALTSHASQAEAPTSWPTVQSNSDPPVAVFIGDAYAAGSGASAPDKRWTTILAASQGWREVNLAHGGTGYISSAGIKACGQASCPNYQGLVANAKALEAAVVVVSGGTSDRARPSSDEDAAIAEFYRSLRAALPTVRIIAVGPIAPPDRVSPSLDRIDTDVRAAASSVGAVFVDMLNPTVFGGDMIAPDGANTNDAGHVSIAARVEAALT